MEVLLQISMENCRAILKMIKYKEDVTWPHVVMNCISKYSTRYLTRSLRSLVRYRVEHEKIKFISISEYVIFCLLYKHQ